jgi:predicted transcriptional regulator of viral defense system
MDVLYRLAEPQAGYFTAAQAVAAGVSRRILTARAARGDLERIRYGIYRLRRFPPHPFEDVTAACLWAGPDSAASHETALAIHDISDAMPGRIHLTVPRPFRGHLSGVVVHRAPLPEDEREMRDGVPVTTVARTLRDVVVAGDHDLLEQAVRYALRREVLTLRQLRRLARDAPDLAPIVIDVLGEA